MWCALFICNTCMPYRVHVANLQVCISDIDLLDKNGDSALYLAAEKGHMAVVEVLLKAEAKSDRAIDLLIASARSGNSTIVNRTVLILVGNGNAGKTTLVRRLQKRSTDAIKATDGIEVNDINIEDVQFKVMDFAGQAEYAHTHALFFNDEAIYLAVFNPRSDSLSALSKLLQMVKDFAPRAKVLLVLTHADEKCKLTEDCINRFRQPFHNMLEQYFSVDSKSGTNIASLEKYLVKLAKKQRFTRKNVPNTFLKLEEALKTERYSTMFSIPPDEFHELAISDQVGLPKEDVDLAEDLLVRWGNLYRLSNRHLVLRPQELADVLACVIGCNVKHLEGSCSGEFNYDDNAVLKAIWGGKERGSASLTFPADLYTWQSEPAHPAEIDGSFSPTTTTTTAAAVNSGDCHGDDHREGPSSIPGHAAVPPFVQLLFDSRLAFPLFDEQGQPLYRALVPAMLPEVPPKLSQGTNSEASTTSSSSPPSLLTLQQLQLLRLFEHFFPEDSRVSECFVIRFEQLPSTFFARLQVELRHLAYIGGSWRHGCALKGGVLLVELSGMTGYGGGSGDDNSLAVLLSYADGERPGRSLVLDKVMRLCTDRFTSVVIEGCELSLLKQWGRRRPHVWYREDITENCILTDTEDPSSPPSSLKSLQDEELPKHLVSPETLMNFVWFGRFQGEQHLPDEWKRLWMALQIASRDLEPSSRTSSANRARKERMPGVMLQLRKCIPSFLSQWNQNPVGLGALWVLLEDSSAACGSTPANGPKHRIVALAPTADHNWVLVEPEPPIFLPPDITVPAQKDESETDLVKLMQDALCFREEPSQLFGHWRLARCGAIDLGEELDRKLRNEQKRLLREVDGEPNLFVEKSEHSSFIGMLTSPIPRVGRARL